MKFYIYTLGCKVNTYESNVMRDKLINNGFIEGTEEDSDICQSIEFKPRYIKCNNNNVLYIDLSLEEKDKGDNYFHSYTINLYKYFDIKAVYNKRKCF